MDASYKIQRGIHVHLIQFFMCPEFWVHITGCLRFLLQFFCYSAPPRRRLFRNCIPDRSGYTCLASGKGDLTGKCHDPEKQQKRSPQKAVSSAENRLSGSVFSNAFRLSRVIVSDHLPPQISLAGQRLTARVPIGRAIHCVLIGRQIVRLPAQPITAVLLVLPPFNDRFLNPYHLHHRGAWVPPHIILVFLPCAFPAANPEPGRQHTPEKKAGSCCDIPRIFYGPCHKRYRKNETDHDNFNTLHTSSFLPLWAGISFYDAGGWFCTASTNRRVSPI